MKITVHRFPSFLMTGQHVFPFGIMIPSGLPGTFYESVKKEKKGYKIYGAQVEYKLQVECHSGTFSNMRFEKPIAVLQTRLANF